MVFENIRNLREDHDYTQRQIAEYLKMPQPQYFRYEQGYRDIPSDVLKLVSYQFLKQVAENEGKSMEAVARDILHDEKYHGNAPEFYQS